MIRIKASYRQLKTPENPRPSNFLFVVPTAAVEPKQVSREAG
jgi:hypothetical protein